MSFPGTRPSDSNEPAADARVLKSIRARLKVKETSPCASPAGLKEISYRGDGLMCAVSKVELEGGEAYGLPQPNITRIRPAKGWTSLRLDELWAYRELLYFLVWRDVKVRYKQTALGAA